MRSFDDIERDIEAFIDAPARMEPTLAVTELLLAGEDVMATWVMARGETPTEATKEGFRLLALHRQGAKGEPSFNACRESCRELVYHYNLVAAEPDDPAAPGRIVMAALLARHLLYFVSGKLEVAGLGEFCCASKPARAADAAA